MRNPEKYFEKNGFIFGVSYRYEFGWKWHVKKFTDFIEAEKWLYTEEYNFCTRELISKTTAEREYKYTEWEHRYPYIN